MGTAAIILAAGEGTRMKSKYPKVLHEICGKPMVQFVIDCVKMAGIERLLMVVGHKAEEVMGKVGEGIQFVKQEQQLGTGHAVMQAREALRDYDGSVLILYGDTPMITPATIKALIDLQHERDYAGVVLTAYMADPAGYGRIIRGVEGNVERIVEEKDATPAEKEIREINSGIYVFKSRLLFKALDDLNRDNKQGEYYLTDVIEILRAKGFTIGALKGANPSELMGINNKKELAEANKVMNKKILDTLMLEGVTIIDPQNTYIDSGVVIGRDTVIYPGCFIEKGSVIGEDCTIGPNSRICRSRIGNRVTVEYSVIKNSQIDDDSVIGPFAYIRPESVIGKGVKIGDFVEVKKSRIDDGAKIPHLSYVGDAQIGKKANLGAGVIIVNYDGFKKHLTQIGDNAFIGCNSNLISPVNIGDDAYIAAGSTITRDVPEKALGVARNRQINKPDWVIQYRKKKQSGGEE
jgi:bifunctional UDP-N-acetylglucosamine pyrophosphorylase/glucosamine-1-phosphate N-acetyltransferase